VINKLSLSSLRIVFRIENIFKNLLIFLPLLLSERIATTDDLLILGSGFLIFSIMTSICYSTNDYTDKKKDIINKLKVNKIVLDKKIIIFLNFFLFLFLIYLYQFTYLFNFYLVVYLFYFYFYNFFAKSFFLIDIIFLTSFYIIRIFYGSELIDLDISYWFLFFFISLFLIFSIFKRMIQISVNNLKSKKNKIINYSFNDYPFLKKIVIFATILNFSTFFLYLYEISYPNTFTSLSAPETRYEQSILLLGLIFIGYCFGLIRVINLVFNKKIKQDIYIFALKDKINYIFLIIYLLFAYFHIG
tara:strand:+ start:581 stop:1486 length:906 start_codon:yes stop_codon:yes gene_type:complete